MLEIEPLNPYLAQHLTKVFCKTDVAKIVSWARYPKISSKDAIDLNVHYNCKII